MYSKTIKENFISVRMIFRGIRYLGNIIMNIFKKALDCVKNLYCRKTKMESEILEQPKIISFLEKKYISKDGMINIDIPFYTNKIALIASGSSYHCATIAANYLRNNIHCDAQSYYASEFSIVDDIDVDSNTFYIFISQSGETADTINSLNKVKSKTNKTVAVTNTVNSTLYNEAKYKILIHAGEEKSIASTKAMSSQLYCLFLIAAKIAQQKELPTDKIICELKNVSSAVKKAFDYYDEINNYSKKLRTYDNAAILASGMFYPLAKEGALKIKETSYINTTAYPTGEFLHGHIAILNKRCSVIAIINNYNIEFTTRVIENIKKNYKSDLFIISAIPLAKTGEENIISVNTMFDIIFVFTALVILQKLAYITASGLNRNVDKPQGLTKVVK